MNMQVRKFLAENFFLNDDALHLDDTASLLEAGIVDSTGILEVIAFVEETFGVSVADDEVVPENLDSIQRIVDYVKRKQAGAGNGQIEATTS